MAFVAFTAQDVFPITPNDSADLPIHAQAILVGVAGDIKIVTPKGETRTFPVFAGWNPVSTNKVFATGTTATGIHGGIA